MEKEIPLYRMIYNKIVNRILVGFYPKGYQLPSAQKIHAQAEIGYTSIRRAMRLLQEEGFIFSEARKAPVVIFDAANPQCRKLRHQIFLSRCQAHLDCYRAIPCLVPGLVSLGMRADNLELVTRLEEICNCSPSEFQSKNDLLKLIYTWQEILVSQSQNSLAQDIFLQIRGFDDLRFLEKSSEDLLQGEAQTVIQALRHWTDLLRRRSVEDLYILQNIFCRQACSDLEREFQPFFNEPEMKTISPVEFRWYIQQSPTPLYKKIAYDLLRQAYGNQFDAGDYFPPENALIEQYQVAAVTIRGALAFLNNLGIAKTRNGIGTLFTGVCTNLEETSGYIRESLESLSILSACSQSLAMHALPLLSEQEKVNLFRELATVSSQDRLFLHLLRTFVKKLSVQSLETIYDQLETRLIFGLSLSGTVIRLLPVPDLQTSLSEFLSLCSSGKTDVIAYRISLLCYRIEKNLREVLSSLLSEQTK